MMDGRSGMVLIPRTRGVARMDRAYDRAKSWNHGKWSRAK